MSTSAQLGDTLGHSEEKTTTGKFVDKITGADKAEKLIDWAFNAAQQHFEGGSAGQTNTTTPPASNTDTTTHPTSGGGNQS